MFRALHNCRFFCGVCSGPKQQRLVIESYFNECFKKNRQRGREGRHPVTYRECREVAKEVLVAAQIDAFSNYYSGDPYLGSRNEELRAKNKEIEKLKLELAQKDRGHASDGYGSNSRYFNYNLFFKLLIF